MKKQILNQPLDFYAFIGALCFFRIQDNIFQNRLGDIFLEVYPDRIFVLETTIDIPMPKTTEIKSELREFNAIFEKLARRWDDSQIFHDFLIMSVCSFYPSGCSMQERDDAMKRYDKEEKGLFRDLYFCWMTTFQKEIQRGRPWWDFFGDFYEALVSRSKSSRLGQFFTPESVVDVTVAMTIPKGITGKSINDPTCGSGRFLIAAHVMAPGNYMYGEDIDPICCYMSGCSGEIIMHDTLKNPDSFTKAWQITPRINGKPSLGIIPIEPHESVVCNIWKNMLLNNTAIEIKKTA